jgi:hypothetical protein
MWQFNKDTVIKWYYYDGDEYDQPYTDTVKWIPGYSYSQMNYQFEFLMTTKRIINKNGICRYIVDRDTGLYKVPGWQLGPTFEKDNGVKLIEGDKVRYLYTLGSVWSRGQYGKGYFEIRFKATDAIGTWPAFWLYGTNQKDEIDFFELKGERNDQIHIDTHCPEGCDSHYTGGRLFPKSFGGWVKTTQDLKDGYNIVAGEWQDGYVKWYLNGEGIGYFKGDFASQKMSLITGMGIAKDGFPFSPGVSEKTKFPNSIDVDYIRVWYKDETDKKNVLGIKHDKFYYYNDSIGKSSLKKKVNFMYKKSAFPSEQTTISLLPSGNKKYIITSLGRKINYSISFGELSGKELLTKNIDGQYSEVDLSGLTNEKQINAKINCNGKIAMQTIRL